MVEGEDWVKQGKFTVESLDHSMLKVRTMASIAAKFQWLIAA